jgi:hypothetical protein
LLSISFSKEFLGPFGEATQFAPPEALAALRQHFRSGRISNLLTHYSPMSNTMNMRKFGLKMVAGAAIAGCALLSQAQSASALSLNFSPTGSSLDADGIKDIATNVGGTVKFVLSLETNGVDPLDSISKINYSYAWDRRELQFESFTSLLGTDAGSGTTTPSSIAHTFGLNAVQGFDSVSNPLPYKIAEVIFTVIRLRNDGRSDFSTRFVSAFDQNDTRFTNVTGTQRQFVEVQDKVPTPALLPGIAAMGLGLLRKRQSKTATA